MRSFVHTSGQDNSYCPARMAGSRQGYRGFQCPSIFPGRIPMGRGSSQLTWTPQAGWLRRWSVFTLVSKSMCPGSPSYIEIRSKRMVHGGHHTYTARNKLPVDYAALWWHDSRQWERQGWIHPHPFQDHGLQVTERGCRSVVYLIVRLERGADLFLQRVKDVRVLLKIVRDARESCGRGFTARNPLGLLVIPIFLWSSGSNRARTQSLRSELQFARLTGCLPHDAPESW